MTYVKERLAEIAAEVRNRTAERKTLLTQVASVAEGAPSPSKSNAPRVGFVYFMKSGGMVKIGFTTDLEQRTKTIRNGNPHELTLLGAMPGTDDTEFFLHQMFAPYRSTGEWFRIEGALDVFLASLPSSAKTRKRGRRRQIAAYL
jgi:hypothetical protein